MPKVSPLSSTAWQVGAIMGPAIGGFLYARLMPLLLHWCCFFMLSSVIFSSFLKPKPPYETKSTDIQGTVARIKEGLRYVFGNKIILSAMSLDLFAVLFGGAVALLPVFASDILHVGSLELGWLRAAPSIGAATFLLALSLKPPETDRPKLLSRAALVG